MGFARAGEEQPYERSIVYVMNNILWIPYADTRVRVSEYQAEDAISTESALTTKFKALASEP